MTHKIRKNIVVIGGGTGVTTVLSGLKQEENFNLTAIVPVSDQGGSSGEFIKAFEQKISLGKGKIKIVPPGDVANAITALSYHEEDFITLLNHRTLLNGHNPRNIIVDAAIELWGIKGIEKLGEFLRIKGKVFPVADQFIKIRAILEDGTIFDSIEIKKGKNRKILKGEEAIDFLSYQKKIKKKVKKIELAGKNKNIKIYQGAKEAILNADIIIFTPSDLWTSTVPILLIPGVKQALKKTKALIVYFCPLMSKYLHTDNFTLWDFVEKIENYSFPNIIRLVFYNSSPIPPSIAEIYKREKAKRIELGKTPIRKNIKIVKMDLLDKKAKIQNPRDKVKRSIIRHDPLKILKAVYFLDNTFK